MFAIPDSRQKCAASKDAMQKLPAGDTKRAVQRVVLQTLPNQMKPFSQRIRSWNWTVSVGCSLLRARALSLNTVEVEPIGRMVQSVRWRRSLVGDPGVFQKRNPMKLTWIVRARRSTGIKGSPQFRPNSSSFLKSEYETVRRVLALQSRLVLEQSTGVLDCELKQVNILSVYGADPPGEGVQLHILPDTDHPRLSDVLSVFWRELQLACCEVIVRSVPSSQRLGLRNDESRTRGMRRAEGLWWSTLEQSAGPQKPQMHYICGGVWTLQDGRLFAIRGQNQPRRIWGELGHDGLTPRSRETTDDEI
jgi:hypothetical protein